MGRAADLTIGACLTLAPATISAALWTVLAFRWSPSLIGLCQFDRLLAPIAFDHRASRRVVTRLHTFLAAALFAGLLSPFRDDNPARITGSWFTTAACYFGIVDTNVQTPCAATRAKQFAKHQ
jgi:hypothetical protein